MKKTYSITIPALLFLIFISCQSEQVINIPEEDFDEPISYATQVQPIFNSSCGGSGCHINNRRSGVNLTNYQETMSSRGSAFNAEIVVPGDADNSPLVQVLGSNPPASRQMPLNASSLTAQEIGLIRAWINEGALDN
jgi:hypothetical protein